MKTVHRLLEFTIEHIGQTELGSSKGLANPILVFHRSAVEDIAHDLAAILGMIDTDP
jgi:hypothetical protein